MADFAARFAAELWSILVDSGVWLVVGLALAGVVHVLVPREFMAKHLAGRGVAPVLKASLLGIPLPLCSCSVIPVAAGLRASGASKGASAAFAISTPQTGEESIPLTWALFGPVYALVRPVIAVATAFTAGMLIDGLVRERRAAGREQVADPRRAPSPPSPAAGKPCCGGGTTKAVEPGPPAPFSLGPMSSVPNGFSDSGHPHDGPADAAAPVSLGIGSWDPDDEPAPCCGGPAGSAAQPSAGQSTGAGSCCHTPAPASSCCGGTPEHRPRRSLAAGAVESMRYGFGTLLRDLAPWLAVGLLLSALVGALVPDGWIEQNIGTGLVPMLLMLLVGLPLYVCATSTTPLAYTLVVAGLSPGAALVLLLAGPATNAATMAWVIKDLGRRALAIYLATIAVFAVAGGLLFDALLRGTIDLAEQGATEHHAAVTVLQGAGAGLLAVLLLWALGERLAARLKARQSETPAGSCCHSD